MTPILMVQFTTIQQICIWALPILLGITFHELAHGYVAYYFGDNTAKMFGRLTINPIKHIDPIGTIAIPLVIGIITNFNFVIGYAKPIPVNPAHLKNPRRDMILVTLAGPLANLLMAFLWTGCLKIATLLNPQSSMAAPVEFHFDAIASCLTIILIPSFLLGMVLALGMNSRIKDRLISTRNRRWILMYKQSTNLLGIAVLLISILLLSTNSYNPFLYFRF